MPRLRTDAWLLRGISSIPGELRLGSGSLSFVASGAGSAWPFQLRKLESALQKPGLSAAIEQGKALEFFNWPASQVTSEAPWYYFGGGIKLRHQSIQLRFSFGRPANPSHNVARAAAELREVGTMRSQGKLWTAALARAAEPPQSEA